MKHDRNPFTPEPAPDEALLSKAEGPVSSPRLSHLPATFEPDLARSGADPALTSTELVESYVPVTADARGRAIRHDGFTPDRQTMFLSVLASCGVVADACRAAEISRETAYAFRNSLRGHAFALAWDAAAFMARRPVSDELMSRTMNGCIERIYRNGELWGERHRHDNRLAMAVLSRLDRQVAEMGEGVATARVIAQHWEAFLGIVGAGGEEAASFLAARVPGKEKPEAAKDVEATVSMLATIETFRLHGEGRADRIETADLDPDSMRDWTSEQWLRADLSGFLAALPKYEWPRYAADEEAAAYYGKCQSRQVYLAHYPDSQSDLGSYGSHVWEEIVWDAPSDGDDTIWMTDYPPPADFDGHEEGEWGDSDYKRELSAGERAMIASKLEADRAEAAAKRAPELEAARAARDSLFGFTPRAAAPGDGGTAKKRAGKRGPLPP